MKTKQATHTPTPWIDKSTGKNTVWIEGANNRVVMHNSTVKDQEDKANATFIVLAVNSHEELVKTLREANQLLDFLGKEIKYKSFDFTDKMALFSQIGRFLGMSEQAIAKAEGK